MIDFARLAMLKVGRAGRNRAPIEQRIDERMAGGPVESIAVRKLEWGVRVSRCREGDKLAKIMDEYYAAWGWYHEGASPPLC
jgi:hypothetical protein